MKRLILILLCLPFLSNAQMLNRIEVREHAGYGFIANNLNDMLNSDNRLKGFSNRISVGYHFSRHLSIHAFYEYGRLNSNDILYTHSHALGISPEYRLRSFYVGVDAKIQKFDKTTDYGGGYSAYNWSFCYGAHIGLRQKVIKGLYIMEECGYGRVKVAGTTYYYPLYPSSGMYPVYVSRSFAGHTDYGYLRAGLSIRL